MTQPIHHFLLVFDHDLGELVESHAFGTKGELAVAAYALKEQEYTDRPNVEIVLIGSDSIETVRLTHANYFDGTAAVSKYLVGLEALAAGSVSANVPSSVVRSPGRRRRQ